MDRTNLGVSCPLSSSDASSRRGGPSVEFDQACGLWICTVHGDPMCRECPTRSRYSVLATRVDRALLDWLGAIWGLKTHFTSLVRSMKDRYSHDSHCSVVGSREKQCPPVLLSNQPYM